MRAGRRAGAGQPRQLFLSAVIMDHDVERAFQVIGINLDVARKQQPCTGPSPTPVEGLKSRSGMVVDVGYASLIALLAMRLLSLAPQGKVSGSERATVISWCPGWARLGAGLSRNASVDGNGVRQWSLSHERQLSLSHGLSSHEPAAIARVDVLELGRGGLAQASVAAEGVVLDLGVLSADED
jgi:hypothetical protein